MAADEPAVPGRPWQVGDRIADTYDVRAVLGEGGMGVVHRVRHLGWDTDLAVKSPLAPGMRGSAERQRFIREAETWVGFGPHPHVCTCHYVRVLDGVPRLFIEYLQGGSLAQWIADGRLYQGSPAEVMTRLLDIAIQAAWGLIHAHEQGVVHQDVKPANILLDPAGTVKITDFGLARAQPPAGPFPAAGSQTLQVSYGGMTRAYASPEQYGRSAVGRRSDVWSFAVSLLEMVTGGITWNAGPAAGAVLAALRADGFRTRAAGVEVPAALDDLLARCLRPDPTTRPAMAAVAAELTSLYAALTGDRYPRSLLPAGELRATELSNRALSLLDLDRGGEALAMLDEACAADSQHPEAVYNRGLLQWRAGAETDEQLINQLETAGANSADRNRVAGLLERVRLERGPAEPTTDLLGHLESAEPVELTADHRHAWSVDEQNTASVWDLPAGRRLCTLAGHTDIVLGLALTPDGRRALTGSGDGTVRVWDVPDGRCVRVLTGHDPGARSDNTSVFAVFPVPGGRTFLSSGADNTIREWDLDTGSCLRVLTVDVGGAPPLPDDFAPFGFVTAAGMELCVSADRRFLLCSRDGQIWVRDYATGAVLHVLTGHTNSITSLCTTGAGRHALSASTDATVRVWDLETGRQVRVLPGQGNPVTSVSATADGEHAVTYDQVARVWELTTGRCVRTVSPASVAALTSDDLRVLTITDAGDVFGTRWRGGVPAAFQVSRPRDAAALVDADARVAGLVARARAARAAGAIDLALAALREARQIPGYERASQVTDAWHQLSDRCVHVDLSTGRQAEVFTGFREAVTSVVITPDGRHAVSGSYDGKVQLWDLPNRRLVRDFGSDLSVVDSVCVTPDGSRTAAVIHRAVQVWDTTSGEPLHTLPHPTGVEIIHVLPDGRRLVSSDRDREVRVWNLSTGRCEISFSISAEEADFHWTRVLCVTPDGRHALSTHNEGTLRLWELATGWCVRVLNRADAHTRAGCVTGDGRLLVTGGGDGDLSVWDLLTGRRVRTLTGHTGTVYAVTLTADDRYALSAGDDDAIRVWDLSTGRCLRTLSGHTGTVEAVSIGPDGHRAVSAGADGTMRVWEFDWELAVQDLSDWASALEPYLYGFLALGSEHLELLMQKARALGFGGLHEESLRRELARLVPDHPVVLARRADECAAARKVAKAVELNDQALGLLRRAAAAHPDAWRHDLVGRLGTHAFWLGELRRWNEALQVSEEAIGHCRSVVEPHRAQRLSHLMYNHYIFLCRAKRRDGIEEWLRLIHQEVAASVHALYLPGLDHRDLSTAQDLLSQYENLPADHESRLPGRVAAQSVYSRMLFDAGRPDQARWLFNKVVVNWSWWLKHNRNSQSAPLVIGLELLETADLLGERTLAGLIRRALKIPRR